MDALQGSTTIRRVCAGSEGKALFTLESDNRVTKRSNINAKKSFDVYLSENERLIYSILCLRGNVMIPERVAVLIKRRDLGVCDYELLVFELDKKKKIDSVTFKDDGDSCLSVSFVELHSGEIVVNVGYRWIALVWKIGDQNTRPLTTPSGSYITIDMNVLENVLGRGEVLALLFWRPRMVGIYAIEQNNLVLVQILALEFVPFSMLWIASKHTLLVADGNGNNKEMFALRLTHHDAFPDKVTFEGYTNIRVRSWCVLPDLTGNEEKIILFDKNTNSLMKFHLA